MFKINRLKAEVLRETRNGLISIDKGDFDEILKGGAQANALHLSSEESLYDVFSQAQVLMRDENPRFMIISISAYDEIKMDELNALADFMERYKNITTKWGLALNTPPSPKYKVAIFFSPARSL